MRPALVAQQVGDLLPDRDAFRHVVQIRAVRLAFPRPRDAPPRRSDGALLQHRDQIGVFERNDDFPVPRPLRDPGIRTPFEFILVEQELGFVLGEVLLEEAADLGVGVAQFLQLLLVGRRQVEAAALEASFQCLHEVRVATGDGVLRRQRADAAVDARVRSALRLERRESRAGLVRGLSHGRIRRAVLEELCFDDGLVRLVVRRAHERS
mmetsp:Transcript_3500/g.9989  ORF Transcript_3500/g.9989 Transcript_3500/m.9989 type:complete len:209 (-) Transcript_3500:375-1001(-)